MQKLYISIIDKNVNIRGGSRNEEMGGGGGTLLLVGDSVPSRKIWGHASPRNF